ncbi:MAG: hypothetical protein JWN73_4485 [Betaproteobacteria bacterium]|nr:hypothetical protein [Betaproteobacteria bacterium]
MFFSFKRAAGAALAAALLATAQCAAAQDFPAQPVHIVVPYPPGGTTDLIARQYAEFLGREVGQSVVIDNRPGAATNIGADAVARSKADGLTLLFGGVNQVLNPAFGPAPPFDLLGAMEPVSLVARTPFIVAGNPAVPFNNPKELVAAARAEPGKLTISSAQLDVYVELLKKRAGINLLHVPYKGGAPATADAIGGQVNMVYALVPVLLPHIQGGKLKAVGLTSARRVPSLPNTPTFMESGVNFESSVWYGLIAPAGLPKPVRERLAQAAQKIVANAEFAQKMRSGGADAVYAPPEEFKKQLEGELVFWSQTAKAMPQLVVGK